MRSGDEVSRIGSPYPNLFAGQGDTNKPHDACSVVRIRNKVAKEVNDRHRLRWNRVQQGKKNRKILLG